MSELGRFLTDQEKEYREKREDIISKTDKMSLANNPFLFANRITVSESIARYELFKKTLNISGAILECGVHSGNNLLYFSHLSSLRKVLGELVSEE